ncbi:MAG: hypothetical protein LBB66_07880 [Desulfovibrio sp.]|jgi:pyruvate formate lyase activating enzyme|nr:hypothetical protein [Desulfovibrio sp.]
MSVTVFSSTGCIRCNIVKTYLNNRGISFVEHDIKTTEGSDVFKAFYREQRSAIQRDENGIFFPVISDNGHVVQDAGSCLAWFICGNQLDGAVTPNNLGHGWIGGLNISACNAGNSLFFLEILRLLKTGGLAIALSTTGNNPFLLEKILKEKLADKVEFKFADPKNNNENLATSLAVVECFTDEVNLNFIVDINAAGGRLALADVALIAKFLADTTGNTKLPLCIVDSSSDNRVNLLPYRTEARRWQTLAELA